MLELRKKGNKHWLFIDNEIGEFTPSKFTINRLNNVITIVYFNNLKSKDYNVSDCYIFDIGDISGFNTSDGVAFMDKLEELNCPCFQKDVTNIYGGGSVESVNGQTGDVILGFSDITTAQNLGEFIDGLDSKTDIKDVDEFIISDSEDSLKSKKTRFSDLKTKLKSYFDTFYLSLSIFNDFVTDVFSSLDNKLDKSSTPSSVYATDAEGLQVMKPISTLQPSLISGTNIKTLEGQSLLGSGNINLTSNDVGLGNVNNTSDLNKPISTATQTALNLKENLSNKATNLTSPDDTKYPTTLAVSTALNSKQDILTNPITGTGTTNFVSKFTGPTSLGNSQIFDNGTNVGIGTTAPGARLDVKAQGALATDIAFRVRNSTDTKNFLVVNGAGDVSNSGAGGGETNTHFGIDVGRNRTGSFNSLFGNQAGRDLTTGASNALFGYNAGASTTTQFGNTFIGARAGESNIANNNTAVGSNALLNNKTGVGNTAIGNEALYYTTTGILNNAFGIGAGINNTTGGRNTFFGAFSGRSNTTGQSNIYIGVDSAFAQKTGNNNIFVGDGSGRFLADGVAHLTISNNSLFLGRDTRAKADNQTNQIVIGDSAIGDGSNSVVLGNSSITRTRLQGQVIMGSFTTAPTGIEGAIYYDSTTKKHYGFDGTTWNAFY